MNAKTIQIIMVMRNSRVNAVGGSPVYNGIKLGDISMDFKTPYGLPCSLNKLRGSIEF